jgi:O-antigen ligase
MIRLTALWLVVFAVGIYTWKDWFRGLCGLVLLLGILEYPDVPRSMFGVPGLNFFNLLLVNVVFAWLAQRRHEGLKWDMPPLVSSLLVVYLFLIFIGWIRLFRDPAYLEDSSTSLVVEYLFNTVKWTIPGMLFFDGCRTRERLVWATFSFLGALVFLGLMTIKIMPLGSVLMDGGELQKLALKLTVSRIGYHRVTLSMMLAGASWALIAARPLVDDRRLRLGMLITAGAILYAQALTGGRGGYVTWGIIGLIVGLLRWRKVFLAMPVVALAVVLLMPGVVQRMMDGFITDPYASATVNEYEASAGRTAIWPVVIAKIKQEPLVGFGRQGMWRTGVVAYLFTVMNEDFGHPHNAYLEWLLDNGVLGFFPVMLFYLLILYKGFQLFLEKRSAACTAAGGVACALVLALMVAGMTSQSFYPIEGTVEMWCAMGLMLRLSVERERALAMLAQPAGLKFGTVREATSLPVDAAAFDALVLNGAPALDRRPRTQLPFQPGAQPTFAPHFSPTAAPATGAPQFTPRAPAATTGSWQRPRMPIADRSRERYRFS